MYNNWSTPEEKTEATLCQQNWWIVHSWRKTIFITEFHNKGSQWEKTQRNSDHMFHRFLVPRFWRHCHCNTHVECRRHPGPAAPGRALSGSALLKACPRPWSYRMEQMNKLKPKNLKHLQSFCNYAAVCKLYGSTKRLWDAWMKSIRAATVIIWGWFASCLQISAGWISLKSHSGLHSRSANLVLWDVWNARPETQLPHPKPVLPLWSHLPIHSSEEILASHTPSLKPAESCDTTVLVWIAFTRMSRKYNKLSHQSPADISVNGCYKLIEGEDWNYTIFFLLSTNSIKRPKLMLL